MSLAARPILLGRLVTQRFDVLVIGGGIVGAGIARDAAMRGLCVALIEQGDFASGTSSKTSKLIHGGLRYLEHGEFGLVYQSLRERTALRAIAPAYVKPLTLMLPVYRGDRRRAPVVNLGLWLYDALAGRRNIRRHRMLGARGALALEPSLRMDGLRAAGLYADCQMDDARVCLANILQAASFGAACANYVRLRALLTAQGRVCGGAAEDALTGRTFDIQAAAVVNAAGPWGDRVRRLSDPAAPRLLAPTKGIHLVLPRVCEQALFVQARADGRMCFILPWGAYSLVGTTEREVGPTPLEALAATQDEVGYLLTELNRLLPGAHVGEEDIVATFAGARPLLAFGGEATAASREHRIELDARGLLSVLGGKYTTYRLMAAQAVDALAAAHRWRLERCLTDQISLVEEAHPVAMERWGAALRALDPDLLARCLARYGTGIFRLLELIHADPLLARRVCPHHEHIEAELVHAVQQELACTITDILARRTRIAWSSCQGLDLLSGLVALLQRYAGWPRAELERQVEAYHQFLLQGLAFRPAGVPSFRWSDTEELPRR
ncbi:MAG: glycerol-3-phosphate dehydrogenase/oxidase [Candidatus Omnitrophica bacterium]|nr:glycerol-3-phosphate dehydrogenase/oxidase [Candidatus Omnitrophota bacterium]